VKVGAWIHDHDDVALDEQVALAAKAGLQTIRSYRLVYAEKVLPALKKLKLSLLAGLYVRADDLVGDWRSQVHLDKLARYHEMGVPLEAVCVGNELREGGDDPVSKRFTARLSFGLANVMDTYRRWLDAHGHETPLTYAMERIVFDNDGYFYEWLWPLIDVCDVVSLNVYPMGDRDWFTYGAFEESRRFLYDARERNRRLALFELQLRRVLDQLAEVGKPVILSETGFPSAVGYRKEGERLLVPESDDERYGELMVEFASLLRRIDRDYGGLIRAVYFYEWRDNLYHRKIWNVEQSPIHIAFGLCDRFGTPKFDLEKLVQALR